MEDSWFCEWGFDGRRGLGAKKKQLPDGNCLIANAPPLGLEPRTP
jgi:hypothetical protein